MIYLPLSINEKITEILNKNGINWLKSATALSLKYRAERVKLGINYIKDFDDALGYLALRAPSTYSQIYSALNSVKELNPNWQPKNILDLGSGPGTGIWAAKEVFPSITETLAAEQDKNFIQISKQISAVVNDLKIEYQEIDLTKSLPKTDQKFDLIIIANVLNEMDPDTINKVLNYANNHSQGIILIVEPATPYGFESISEAKELISSNNNYLIAPYIEKFIDDNSINFSQRIKRPEFQKRVRQQQRKSDALNSEQRLLPPSDWEESKYYYLAFSKFKSEIIPTARIIEKPKQFKPFIELKVLTKDGIKTEKVFKKDKQKYTSIKKINWGDLYNFDII